MKKIIVLGANSDIGAYLCNNWLDEGYNVIGTYRVKNEHMDKLETKGLVPVKVDLSKDLNLNHGHNLMKVAESWDLFISCIGDLRPLVTFEEANFSEWKSSFDLNFLKQIEVLHCLLQLPNSRSKSGRTSLFLAGGAMNNATKYMSAYSIAKIGLTKFVELCQFENPKDKFSIIGPGWMKTKIHNQTLQAKGKASELSSITHMKTKTNDFNSFVKLQGLIEWVWSSPTEIVGGRNFSLSTDNWQDPDFVEKLKNNQERFKMRRA